MRVVLFGTGNFYRLYCGWFQQHEIVALLDNNTGKQGEILDGVRIESPSSVRSLAFDHIFILCYDFMPIWEQLRTLGVAESKIHSYRRIIGILGSTVPAALMQNRPPFVFQQPRGKRILVITHNFRITGAETVLLTALDILVSAGYEAIVVAEKDGPIRAAYEQHGLRCFVDETLRINDLDHVRWLQALQPDLIILNTVFIYQLLHAYHLSIPVVWWLHDPEMLYRSNPVQFLPADPWPDVHIYAVSKLGRTPFLQRLPAWNVGVLPFGIADTCPVQTEIPTHLARLHIAVVGMLCKVKNTLGLYQALRLVPKEIRQHLQVRMIYQNQNEKEISDYQAAAEDLPEIVFAGRFDQQGMHGVYEQCDVLLCPSKEECMPTVAVEAMMHGRPCIVTRQCGVTDYLHDRQDSILTDADPAELAAAITWAWRHRAQLHELGRQARHTYEETFALDSFAQKLLRIIRQYLSKREDDPCQV